VQLYFFSPIYFLLSHIFSSLSLLSQGAKSNFQGFKIQEILKYVILDVIV
jgi:hypothetical protein